MLFRSSDESTKPIGNKWYMYGVGTLDLDIENNLVYIKPTSVDEKELINTMSIFTLSAAKKYRKFI